METVLRSAGRELRIGGENPFCIVGERINTTGRKIFQDQLRRGDLSRIEIDVAQQVAGGAMMLDVNMGAPLADEAELMVAAVKLIQGLTDLGLLSNSLPGYLSLAVEKEQDLDTYYKPRALKPLRPNQMSYWQNYPKFFVSLQKAWWGDAATAAFVPAGPQLVCPPAATIMRTALRVRRAPTRQQASCWGGNHG